MIVINSINDMELLLETPGKITELDLSGFDFSTDHFEAIISQFPNLKKLDLSNPGVNENELSIVSKHCPLLEMLDISETCVTELSAISSLTHLKALYAYDTGIKELSPLKGLPLVKLKIGRAQVSDLTPLGKMPTLKQIVLQGNANLIDLTALSQLVGLVKLDVKGTAVGADGLAALESLEKLTELEVNVDCEFAAKATLATIKKNFYNKQRLSPSLFSSNQGSKSTSGISEEQRMDKEEEGINQLALSGEFKSELKSLFEKHSIPSTEEALTTVFDAIKSISRESTDTLRPRSFT